MNRRVYKVGKTPVRYGCIQKDRSGSSTLSPVTKMKKLMPYKELMALCKKDSLVKAIVDSRLGK